MKSKFFLALVLGVGMFTGQIFGSEDWSGIVSHNITVRLTGVRRTGQKPFNLVARFVTDDRAAREFTVEFPDNPPDAHVATIMNVIEHAASSRNYGGHSEWLPLNMDVLLSVPPDAQGVVTNFTRWGIFTVSIPDYLTAHWEDEALSIDKVLEQSDRIVVAKCVSAGGLKISGLTTMKFEVEHVIKGAETNREIFVEAYGYMRPGDSYLICLNKKPGAEPGERIVIGNGLLPIMEAGWADDWNKLSPKEQITQIIAVRMSRLKNDLEADEVERERLQKVLAASYPRPETK